MVCDKKVTNWAVTDHSVTDTIKTLDKNTLQSRCGPPIESGQA